MSIDLSSNFLLSAQLPLDARDVVADIAARDAIPAIQRYRGMSVVVLSGASGNVETWMLQAGITNSDWILITSGAGLTGAGSPNSVAYWSTVNSIGSNIFFTRNPVTSIVANNTGYTADYDTTVNRYIDPAGNDSNTGTSAGPSNAWLTPEYAVQQCQLLGPGMYIIHCAAGTYTNATFDTTNVVSRGFDGRNVESIIQFEGDQTTPSNVIFQNASSSIVYHSSPITTLRLHGLRLEGGGSNVGIFQSSGKIILRNIEGDSYQTFYSIRGNSSLSIEAPVTLTDTSTGVSSYGGFIQGGANIQLTPPNPLVTDPVLFSIVDTFLSFNTGITATLNPRSGIHIITSNGYLIDAYNSIINFSYFNTFKAEECKALWRLDFSSVAYTGSPNTFWVIGAQDYCEAYNQSVFEDASGNTWLSDSLVPGGVQLGTGAIFSSPVILQTGTPPVTFLQDYMYAYVKYPNDPTYTSYALDNRYTQEYTFTCLGELPQGYTLADLNESGITSKPKYFFIAPYNCEVIKMIVGTGVANGASHTDTYYLYANGVASGMSVAITNGDFGDTTSPVVQLVDGDICSIKVTSDAGTTAEDITVVVLIRRRA